MKSAFQPERLWPRGHRELNLLVTPDLHRDDDLAIMLTRIRTLLKQHPATDRPVPDEWVHLTVQSINHGLAREPVGPAARTRLIEELAGLFASLPSFSLLLGSLLAYNTGVLADVHYDEPFNDLVNRARTIIATICGQDSIGHDSTPGHMALAYAHGEQETDTLQRQLRRIRPSHATLTVDSIVLAEVQQDPAQCVYRWNVLHRFPLAIPVRDNRTVNTR
ncbi:hypothetical protein [Amycolatopsis sp. RTGN1]|uniref:hypothetical protein n=1 Tax=Amycolatopsis ponsaeliensis TaxID=2992142 RepID=UPI00254DB01D|nr:hypothetical protein [Amycolatopsis sp. RTGN1]